MALDEGEIREETRTSEEKSKQMDLNMSEMKLSA
jgi:hypothetical protein